MTFTRRPEHPGVTKFMTNIDGVPVVAAKPNSRGWIVLCDISEHNSVHPFVTWWMDVDGHTFHGNYYENFDDALSNWEERL